MSDEPELLVEIIDVNEGDYYDHSREWRLVSEVRPYRSGDVKVVPVALWTSYVEALAALEAAAAAIDAAIGEEG